MEWETVRTEWQLRMNDDKVTQKISGEGFSEFTIVASSAFISACRI